MFCKKCGKEIPSDSVVCPVCGSPQKNDTVPAALSKGKRPVPGKGLSITSLVFGILALIAVLLPWMQYIQEVTLVGLSAVTLYSALISPFFFFIAPGIIMGAFGMHKMLTSGHKKGLALAGIILCCIALFFAVMLSGALHI